jgi:hypothetical protein
VRRLLPGLAVALLSTGPALADEADALHAAADGFYRVYSSLPRGGGIPDDQALARYAPYLAPDLDGLLRQAQAAEDRFTKNHLDSPPLIEGDLFSSLFEGATSVTVGACTVDGRSGSCAVELVHSEPLREPVSWTDTVRLTNTPQGWRVSDIAYGGTWAFGNKGTLTATLREVLAFQ